MATKTITSYEHTCDLCGAQHAQEELTKLYGPSRQRGVGGTNHHDEADICTGCQAKPISELVTWFAARKNAPVIVRVKLTD